MGLLRRKENSPPGFRRRRQVRLRRRTVSTSRFRNVNLIPFRPRALLSLQPNPREVAGNKAPRIAIDFRLKP